MAIDQRQALILVISVTVFAVIGMLLTLAWMYPLTVDSLGHHQVALYVTNVQFINDYLNMTVRNVGVKSTIISSVIINQNSTLHTVLVCEPILTGEIITIRIAFKWTSGYTYQMRLETADNLDYNYCNTFSAIAP